MRVIVSLVCLAVLSSGASAADWPMFGGNPARSGYVSESLPAKLSLRWVSKGLHKPAPAWPVSNRLGFDLAFHPVIAGDMLFYGSSADNQLHALDVLSGQEKWTFHTEGPVRFAPVTWKDMVFVASDDGWLYALAAIDGKVCWKQRGGPDARMLLGNDRMVARLLARGGPVIVDDVLYFAAGIWPTEGVSLYALEPATGKIVWLNKDSGSIFMGQPHAGANAVSGVAAQGHLVVSGEQLFVPTGRAVPAAFDRETGKFKYFHLQANTKKGGTTTLATELWFYNAGFTYDAATGQPIDPIDAGEVAAAPEGIFVSGPKGLTAYGWLDKSKEVEGKTGKLELLKYRGLDKLWTLPAAAGGSSIVVAGDTVVSGAEGKVTMVNRKTKKVVWSGAIEGDPLSLAVADGRLFVSTRDGALYCFDSRKTNTSVTHVRKAQERVYGENTDAVQAAAQIVRQSGMKEGYVVDLGCRDGALAYELAKAGDFHVIGVDSDPELVAAARKKLDAAGLLGVRVTILLADPAASPLPRYFANLVVSSRSLTDGVDKRLTAEIARVQRPFGGVALVGNAGELTKTVRGPLAGAGNWTHQYADPANTSCSADNLVQGSLGMLWFRDSDLVGPSRHGRGPAPLFLDGRLFSEGTHGIRAVDAYNGRRLWEHPLPNILKPYDGDHLVGTASTQSNYCVTPDGVYVRLENRCLRLDPVTGKKLGEFTAPKTAAGETLPWGYIACDRGLLFGSLANPKHVTKFTYGKADMRHLLSESEVFFVLDAKTGEFKWSYAAKHSIRHNAIAVGKDRVFLIDRPMAEKDRPGVPRGTEHPEGELVALDAASGREAWRNKENIYGTLLAVSIPYDVVVMSYQPTRFRLPSESGNRIMGLNATTGAKLWDSSAAYSTRPLVNGKTIYAQGGAWDVVSGEAKPFELKRSYGCGQLASSTHLMVFRSATLGYFDLQSPKGVVDYGGLRPGCWINAIPAGGVVLVPDATSRCRCSYLNQAWIALQPVE